MTGRGFSRASEMLIIGLGAKPALSESEDNEEESNGRRNRLKSAPQRRVHVIFDPIGTPEDVPFQVAEE